MSTEASAPKKKSNLWKIGTYGFGAAFLLTIGYIWADKSGKLAQWFPAKASDDSAKA